MRTQDGIELSIVIPVFNEERNLEELETRLQQVLRAIGRSYEIIFVDDGSSDGSLGRLRQFAEREPTVRVIEFNRNYGQHAAVLAGFSQVRGEITITLDADLQNPPEEIPKLLAKMEEGVDVVGGYRQDRQDTWMRRWPSALVNKASSWMTGVHLKDYGCMLRAYRRPIVDHINQCSETATFIPALANSFAKRVAEVPVGHAPRMQGRSKYPLLKLLQLNFDLMTGFSLLPIQVVGVAGVAVALGGLSFAIFLFVRRLIVGPEVEGVFTLFAILFFFMGLQLLALGLLGEYIGRIYQEVRKRPRYLIRSVHPSSRGAGGVALPCRIVVLAYQDIGYACLEELFRRGENVVAVFTHPDDPQEHVWFRSVKALAEAHHVPVYQPEDINADEWVSRLHRLAPDLLFSFYFRKIVSPEILSIPRLGAFNVHGSLLPKYRGRCPVNWVLIHGERETGLTLHHMTVQPDAGDIVAQRAVPISKDDTVLTLYHKMANACGPLLREVLPLLKAGTAPRIPQDPRQATTFGRRRPEDGLIHWEQPAGAIYNLIRAVTHPYPGAFTYWQGIPLRVWAARPLDVDDFAASPSPGEVVSLQPFTIMTGEGQLRLQRVQLGDEPECDVEVFTAQHGVQLGIRLGGEEIVKRELKDETPLTPSLSPLRGERIKPALSGVEGVRGDP
ncbi:MAG: formyltransferase [Elusimicrobia bacterium]|nr:formyltransferase [Elusimicrobiota bacterium]